MRTAVIIGKTTGKSNVFHYTNGEKGTGLLPCKCEPCDECECRDTWTSSEGDGACTDVQGCPETACDGAGGKTWCIAKKGCREQEKDAESADPWFYCAKKTPQEVKAATTCECKDTWSSEGECDKEINGCPESACDGDDHPWCMATAPCKDSPIDDDEWPWFYCG